MNFYAGSEGLDSTLWNQGVMQIFPKQYSYKQLNDAYNKLVKANDSLRITMKRTQSGIVMQLNEYEYTEYPFWSLLSEKELNEVSRNFLNEPIDVYGRLVKCAVFQTPYSSGIMISGHHAVVDGYSAFVMAEHINNYLQDAEFIPEAYQHYMEYVEAEERHKSTKRYLNDCKFWKEKFSLKPTCTLFEQRNAVPDFASSEVNYTITNSFFDKVKAFCEVNSISVQTYFNTVYAEYIHRTCSAENFTIGVPILNRTTTAELNTIGLYMHIVPLVVNITDESFLEHALKIEDSQLTLFRHQKMTQYDIKKVLTNDGFDINQLFDIVCDYQEFDCSESYEIKLPYSNYLSVPIEIHLQSFGQEKHNLKIRYRTSMFSEEEIQRMLNSIMNIAADALENPHKKISELETVSQCEKQKILYDFNNTAHDYGIPDNSTLYSLFEKTAKENKDKICITTAEKSLSFGELLNISEALDEKIRNITKGNKSVIAVIADRSAEMYAAIYGIIRGGNAYLPVSPDYPEERIEYILENSKAALAVVQDKFCKYASNVPCINMTELIENRSFSQVNLLCAATEDDTAYVIYTSGSTGNPKGAEISHKSAVNRILWMHDKYPLGADGIILQKTPYTFDVSVWEIFWWGICGGSLAVSKPGEHFLPGKILDEVYNNKVTHLHFVPSVFELFLNYLESHKDECYKFDSVRYVFLSGEALSASLIRRFYALYSCEKVSLHNLYGPTECAVDVTYYDCTPEDIDPVPIGKPIYNTSVYVVDKYMHPVPTGVKGELCIGGVNVGKGYLGNPELTAEKFIDNPFGKGKLYKTGDLAFWREDGEIVFCGRIDGQVKLGGQRIEIGEIEAVIGSVYGVDNAAVILRKINGRDMLAAFYCGTEAEEMHIKDKCLKKLPKYMVPSVFVRVDELPLNPSGKLDRKALSEINIDIENRQQYEAPINDSERFVCDAFGKVLSKKHIGRYSDFFENGGTSLSMISLLSESGFEKITAAEFMRNSTPEKLALLINNKKESEFEYLEPLSAERDSDKALILLPFAGGGAEAYGNFVKSLKKENGKISIYFVRYLHSVKECEEAAEEIKNILKDKKLFFYSHCVGSAVALQIIRSLEKQEISVSHYFAGASIPPSKPIKKNIWNIVPDKFLGKILMSAGARLDILSKDKTAELLKTFRKDTDFANISFAQSNVKINAPMSIVINKKDIFTKNYKQALDIWKKYSADVCEVFYIDSLSHYFQSDDSDELIRIIEPLL